METEIATPISELFTAVIGIMGLNVALMFFAYLLGQFMSTLFDG